MIEQAAEPDAGDWRETHCTRSDFHEPHRWAAGTRDCVGFARPSTESDAGDVDASYVMEVDSATGALSTRPIRPDDAFCPHCSRGIADFVAEVRRTTAEQALREAADLMPFGYSHAAHLLREKADQLAGIKRPAFADMDDS